MFSSPKWLQKAVFYEIYPQSFMDSNGDGIGDLEGICQKLDYIKDMGFNAIWLNPIYESLFFDAGYDVSDYLKVAKRYGGNKALTKLIAECHEKGIRLILDLVPGHTAINHKWFKESCKAKQNQYTSRFIWNKDIWNVDPKFNWIRGFYERNGAAMINFFSIQPKLNFGFETIEHPEYEETVDGEGPQGTIHAIEDVVRFYLRQGIDGFRVDMAGWLVARDPEGKGTSRVWRQFFKDIKEEYPDSAFVSEWANPVMSLDSGFDMDFMLHDMHYDTFGLPFRGDHPFFQKDGDNKTMVKYFDLVGPLVELAQNKGRYLAGISGNHDTVRLSEWLDEKEASLAYFFMVTMPNVPFFYYGDELLMHYLKGIPSVEGGYQRTGSRSPMQWDTSKPSAGFSKSKKTYIRLDPHRKGLSVEEETKDEGSLLNALKKLLAFKTQHVALDNDASWTPVASGGDGHVAYERAKDGEKLLMVINPRAEAKLIDLVGKGIVYKSGEAEEKAKGLKIGPQSAVILRL